MRAVISNFLDDLLSSLWFIPALLVVVAIFLSVVFVIVDEALLPDLGQRSAMLFGGTAEAARTVLSVIAGSLVTVIAVAFSVTLVVVQQAASQYSPRLLRNFTSDRGNQVVLGTYIGTFVYALLVMRQARTSTEDQEAFIPSLSLTMGIVLALISLALLVYFIHHTVRSIEITTILNSIRKEIDSELQVMFPSQLGRGVRDGPGFAELMKQAQGDRWKHEARVASGMSGYLRQIIEDRLVKSLGADVRLAVISPRIGEYLPRRSELVSMWADTPVSDRQTQQAEAAFIISPDRSLRQDPLFGIRQIVDMALKALSPGVNDPTTAEQCIGALGDILGELAQREIPSPVRAVHDRTRLLVNRPSFADFVEASLSQIRRTAQMDVHVTLYLLRTLQQVAQRVPNQDRAKAVSGQVMEVLEGLQSRHFSESEEQMIRDEAGVVLFILQRHLHPVSQG